MSVKRGELIVGHIPRELFKRLAFSEVEARGRAMSEIFRDSNDFSVSYHCRDDYDNTALPRAETKLLLCAYMVLQSVSLLPCLCWV